MLYRVCFPVPALVMFRVFLPSARYCIRPLPSLPPCHSGPAGLIIQSILLLSTTTSMTFRMPYLVSASRGVWFSGMVTFVVPIGGVQVSA